MTTLRKAKSVLVAVLISLLHVSAARETSAAFVIHFDNDDLFVRANGTDQFVPVDLLISYDGVGNNTLSSFSIDIENPGIGLTIQAPVSSLLVWDLGPPSLATRIGGDLTLGATSSSNLTFSAANSATLATVTFKVSQDVHEAVFPLKLSLRDANRNLFQNITSEVSTADANFVVAVPEPTAFVFLGVLGLTVAFRRRKREPKAVKFNN